MTAREKVKVGVPCRYDCRRGRRVPADLISYDPGVSAPTRVFMDPSHGCFGSTTTPGSKSDLPRARPGEGRPRTVSRLTVQPCRSAPAKGLKIRDLFGTGSGIPGNQCGVRYVGRVKYSVVAAVDGKQLSDDDWRGLKRKTLKP